MTQYAFRTATPSDAERITAVTMEGFEPYGAFAPEGWRPPPASDESERLLGMLGQDHARDFTGDAPVHTGGAGARAAVLRGLGAGAPAGVRRAHRPRDRGVSPGALSAYSSSPRRIASATAAARSLTPSFS